jgi:tRNA threonylcarbamoyladenosine biosynthesis protein TsaB
MRILGIETTSPVGSVALVEGGRVVAVASNPEVNTHAERTLELIERVLKQAGWSKQSLQRIAVGIGPGSFTGVRIGISIAEGIATGLGIPLLGVGSLRSMALAAPQDDARVRVPLLDARRGEVFAAAYAPDGTELWAPQLVSIDGLSERIGEAVSAGHVLLGVVAGQLGVQPRLASPSTDYPTASAVALAAEHDTPDPQPVLPLYIRDADITLPNLPPSPLKN